jgi:hypothetical protein
MECLGLHNKPKAEVHLAHKLTGPKEVEVVEVQDIVNSHRRSARKFITNANKAPPTRKFGQLRTPRLKPLAYRQFQCYSNILILLFTFIYRSRLSLL